MKFVRAAMLAGLLATPGLTQTSAPAAASAACESLASLALPHTTITLAQAVPAGDFAVPGSNQRLSNLPAFCRVAATIAPVSDSDIKIEVWMPASNWNGRFQGVGNGGWAGTISYGALAAALNGGYAGASTDTGHTGGNATFALGHPEKYIDMGYRAVHEMSVQAKAITGAYYGTAPKLSLWNGCSQGGRQGITETERYPADYDAIIAGAPSVYQMQLNGARMALNLLVHRTPESYIPPAKYPAIHNAVLDACDARDGVTDGVLEDPTQCHFDPKVLACKDADGPSCLTPAQVETARAIYAPIRNPKTGAVLSSALLTPGTELGWATLAGPQPLDIPVQGFKYVVFKDPNWDWHRFDASTDVALALKIDNGVMDLADPNLKPFFSRGGKLLMYHGWADPQVAPLNAVKYFAEVGNTVGKAAIGKSIQLYMVPAWGIVRAAPVRIPLTRWRRWISGLRRARRPTTSWRLTVLPGKSTARALSALTDRWPSGKAPAVQTRPRILRARSGEWRLVSTRSEAPRLRQCVTRAMPALNMRPWQSPQAGRLSKQASPGHVETGQRASHLRHARPRRPGRPRVRVQPPA
jgi:feruloyl esterase